jgi:hypothetical protein
MNGFMPAIGKLSMLSVEIFALFALSLVVLILPNSNEIVQRMRWGKLTGAMSGFVLAVCILKLNRVAEFLYYQF